MAMDVWSSPTARVAATRVFALANEQPLLRPASSAAAARIAAALPIDTEQVPKAVVEELIAGISDAEARRANSSITARVIAGASSASPLATMCTDPDLRSSSAALSCV